MLKVNVHSLLFVDFEASALGDGSYPIEAGWARWDLSSESYLVRPEEGWTEDDWDFRSEAVHGISRERVIAEGLSATEVHARLLAALGPDGVLVSDNPYFDEDWLRRLCNAAGAAPPPVMSHLDLVGSLAERSRLSSAAIRDRTELARKRYPHRHRAGPDAMSLAAQVRAVRDPSFLDL